MVVRDVLGGSVLVSVLALSGCGGGGGDSTADDGGGTTTPQTVVAGSIGIEANTRVDQDTSDFLSFSSDPSIDSPLNSDAERQLLPSSVVLGGYVSADSGARAVGNPYDDYAMDSVDRYSIALAPGDTVRIQTFDLATTHQVRVVLRDPSTGAEISSDSTDPTTDPSNPALPKLLASITLPSDGSYTSGNYSVDIETDVNDAGPVRYVLTKVPFSQSLTLSFDWPRFEFVPSEAIVSMQTSGAQGVAALSALDASNARQLDDHHWLVQMSPRQFSGTVERQDATLNWVSALRKKSGIERVTPNYVMHSQAVGSPQTAVNEPLYKEQWHYGLINVPASWQLAPNGASSVKVAVLDTGVFKSPSAWHPELSGNLSVLPGSDFVSEPYDNDDVNTAIFGSLGPDDIPADPGNAVGSNVFHGTHVAGTIAGDGNNDEGGTGIAFNASLIPVRVLGEGGSGSLKDLYRALDWVASNSGADIVNLSLGGLPYDQELEAKLANLKANNIIVVAAAGNDRSNVPTYPGASRSVFGVSAVDAAGNLASYSNYGDWIDLAGPGGDGSRDANFDGKADLVLSSSAILGDGGYFEPAYIGLQGTSMAAPHVSGVFALMKEAKPNLDVVNDLESWLMAGRLTNGSAGSKTPEFGYGLIDAGKAVATALENPSITVLSPTPYYVSLNSERISEIVTLNPVGASSSVTGLTVGSYPNWLSVSVNNSGANPELTFALTNPQNLDPNVPLQASVSVSYTTDQQRTLDIPVSAQVVTDEQQRNAGVHFVLLVDTTPDVNGLYQAEAQVAATVENGEYQFSFPLENGDGVQTQSEVTPGDYFLVAGTDLDNDGIICQPGEACAEYPVSGLREAIHVDQNTDLTNIRMTTGFSRPTISAATPDVLPRPDFAGYRLIPEDDFVRPLKKLSGE